MTWELHRHDARRISELLEPESVDLIVTSPPYFALRSYRDECEACAGTGRLPTFDYDTADPNGMCFVCNGSGRAHFDGQLGSEATPGEFVDNLIACTADWLKVLKPTGSLFVNLGDKFAGSGGHNNATLTRGYSARVCPSCERVFASGRNKCHICAVTTLFPAGARAATRRNAPDRYNPASDGIPAKSRMGLPWRYAIRCIDELGLILRADIVWSKPNGLPESVTDRVRMSHEYLFHFTRQGRYFAAIDEVREPHTQPLTAAEMTSRVMSRKSGITHNGTKPSANELTYGEERALDITGSNPLGKTPGSVWQIASEPLQVPDHLGVDHFAAFPSELPRRIILGWTPTGWCTACGEPRRAVVDKRLEMDDRGDVGSVGSRFNGTHDAHKHNRMGQEREYGNTVATITGYACGCPTTDAPTRPARVLDPFSGTGTTVAVAHLLGRHGIGTDLSADYLRLAEWRCSSDQRLRDKVLDRTGIPNPDPPKIDGQLDLFEGPA